MYLLGILGLSGLECAVVLTLLAVPVGVVLLVVWAVRRSGRRQRNE